MSVGSFALSSAAIYEVGKRGYIAPLSDYLKKGEKRPNVSFIGVNKEGQRFKIKIGFDIPVWGISMFASLGLLKLLPTFAKYNGQWATGTIVLGQLAVNFWESVIPTRYNPFVWTNSRGEHESVLIFPSKWGKRLCSADGTHYKILKS